MQLAHGNNNFYPIQNTDARWFLLNKQDRHIFFLSTGKNSCEDIAYLLRYDTALVLDRACLLHIRGVVYLKENNRKLYEMHYIDHAVALLNKYRVLCVRTFYDALQQNMPQVRNHVNSVTESQLEGEFFTMLQFISNIASSPSEQIYVLFQSIVEGYRLQRVSNDEFESIVSSLVQAFSLCLLENWTPEIEKSWINFCLVLKHAIFALCQQK